mmetsp:Transcript_37605/g.69421  ORF Transcript_37605/g.69421 Transcript_37605/m.69421 type:complete len:216 (-) Transcript_37605:2897-3544(-)
MMLMMRSQTLIRPQTSGKLGIAAPVATARLPASTAKAMSKDGSQKPNSRPPGQQSMLSCNASLAFNRNRTYCTSSASSPEGIAQMASFTLLSTCRRCDRTSLFASAAAMRARSSGQVRQRPRLRGTMGSTMKPHRTRLDLIDSTYIMLKELIASPSSIKVLANTNMRGVRKTAQRNVESSVANSLHVTHSSMRCIASFTMVASSGPVLFLCTAGG